MSKTIYTKPRLDLGGAEMLVLGAGAGAGDGAAGGVVGQVTQLLFAARHAVAKTCCA
jgi:hypothetical protein